MSVMFLFLLLAVLVLLEVPVAFAMILSAILFLVIDGTTPVQIVVQRLAPSLDSFPLLAIPMFVLAGNLLNKTGIAERIFEFALSLVGHIRGSLAHVNVLASIIFSGMSGVAAADAAGLGMIEMRAMEREGFAKGFSAAVTGASSIIGPIIPPSSIMVLYAVQVGAPLSAMLWCSPGASDGAGPYDDNLYHVCHRSSGCTCKTEVQVATYQKNICGSATRAFGSHRAGMRVVGRGSHTNRAGCGHRSVRCSAGTI